MLTKKRILLVGFLVLIFFSLTTGVFAATKKDSQVEENVNYLVYENADYNVSIKYPEGWFLKENLMATIVAAFFSPLEDENDKFLDNFNLTVQDLSAKPMNMDEYTKLSIKQLKLYITDFKIKTRKKTKLADCEAEDMVFTGRQGQVKLKFKAIWMIKDNIAYVITFGAEEKKYEEYLKIIDEAIESFEIREINNNDNDEAEDNEVEDNEEDEAAAE